MNPSYKDAQTVFKQFRERIMGDSELSSDFESAIVMLRSAYNTAIYENRFIVGGAIEHLVVAAFNGAAMPSHHIGRGDTRVDAIAQDSKGVKAGFSIKASFSSLNVRLINTIGNKVPVWEEPTLFLLSKKGMVYADPTLLLSATVHSKDALMLRGAALKTYIDTHPEYVIPFRFEPPQTGNIPASKTASEDVARSIVNNFKRLSLP